MAISGGYMVLGYGIIFVLGALAGSWAQRAWRGRPVQTPEADPRMLGLALQGQGQLDMALDCFSRAPLTPALMDNLYPLALEFERKRQFDKARGIYQRLVQHHPAYKDAAARLLQCAQWATQTLALPAHARALDTDTGKRELPTLGRYQLQKELGQGAMGVIYLARDDALARQVAIKTMALGRDFSGVALQEARERFFREAEAAARLSHPHIVAVHDAGEEGGLAYIAMELVEGENLSRYTQPERLLPVQQVVQMGVQLARALSHAHSQGVVHRDVKPANLIYNAAQGCVKVTDFGVAHIMKTEHTRTGLILGTPSFMSPEQIAGKPVDGRSDLYSLGVSLYQLLTGALPLAADSMAGLVYAIAHTPAPDVRQLRPGLPEALAQVLSKSLNKQPARRYSNAEQMALALASIAHTLESTATGVEPAGLGGVA